MDAKGVRQIALICFIIFASITAIVLQIMGQTIFAIAVCGCGLAVGIGEVVSCIRTKNTLSTNFTNHIQTGKNNFVLGLTACLSLVISMGFLAVHLLWH